MVTPKSWIHAYFNNIITYGTVEKKDGKLIKSNIKSEQEIAEKVFKGFKMSTSLDFHRFGQYVNYLPDYVGSVTQLMQTLDYTFYAGSGDCEDFARSFVQLAKYKKLPAYYWFAFENDAYQNGHAMPLWINEEGNLTVLDYTSYFIDDKNVISKEDIENNTQNFGDSFNLLHGEITKKLYDWKVNYIIKTDIGEMPVGYNRMNYQPSFQGAKYLSYPNSRFFVLPYVTQMNLTRNLSFQDFILPLVGTGLFLLLGGVRK